MPDKNSNPKPSVDELSTDELRAIAERREEKRVQEAAEDAASNSWTDTLRDIGVTVLSLAGLVRELFFVDEPSSTIILILGGFLGVPFVMKADKVRKAKNGG